MPVAWIFVFLPKPNLSGHVLDIPETKTTVAALFRAMPCPNGKNMETQVATTAVDPSADPAPAPIHVLRAVYGPAAGLAPGALARRDFIEGLQRWWLWNAMGWQDILLRYRGSVLGPFWLTLSMGIMIATLGVLYSTLFKIELHDYMPFLCLGILSWNLLSALVIESCYVFVQAEAIVKQVKLPFSVHAYRMIWRNLIVAGHNVVVYPIVMILFGVTPTVATLLFIPGLALVLLNAVWVAMLLGLICARFRDVPQIVASLVQVVFFVTPIIWKPELLGRHQSLAHLNPFFAFVDLLRAPLLGVAPDMLSWGMGLLTTVIGWGVTMAMFSRFRSRIPYWC